MATTSRDVPRYVAIYYGSAEEFQQQRGKFLSALTNEQRERVSTWLELGKENEWIRRSVDPPFTELSFHICEDLRTFAEKLLHGNWCLGQAFVLDDICMMQQVDGGDEWLTIKGETAFDSLTVGPLGERWSRGETAIRLARTIASIQRSTEEQCRKWEYVDELTRFTWEQEQSMLDIDFDVLCTELNMDIFTLYDFAHDLLGALHPRGTPESYFLQRLHERRNEEFRDDRDDEY